MGLASEEERTEFEMLCTQYPELVEARIQFEQVLETRAMENAVALPAGSKEKIWTTLQTSASNTSKIITMEPTTTRKSPGLRWVAAAAILLLLAATYFAYNFYNKNQKLETSSVNLQSQLDSTKNLLELLVKGQNTTVVNMVATEKAPPSSASIYWDSASNNVWLVVKNMPKLPSDKQYQLWAFIDGKPTDLGLFDVKEENFILRMKGAKNAEAFAITIEKRGNTGGPTVEELQSMGKPKL